MTATEATLPRFGRLCATSWRFFLKKIRWNPVAIAATALS
jgi:hypothetical protein